MNFKSLTFWRFFCCFILLASSVYALDDDDESGEEESHSKTPKNEGASSIEERLNGIATELRKDKERDDLLKIEVKKIYKVLNELSNSINDLKKRDEELNIEVNGIKKKCNKSINIAEDEPTFTWVVSSIKKILENNNASETTGIPFIDFHKCNKSLNIAEDEPTFTWVITDLKNKMNQTKFEMESEIFDLKGYSVKVQAKLQYRHGDLWVALWYKDIYSPYKGNTDVVDVELLPSVIYVFKNQSASGDYNDVITREVYLPFNETFHYDTHYYQMILLRSTYEVSDSALIEIYVESPEQARHGCSDDGTIAWTVDDVAKGRELERKETVLYRASPYFYSGPKGYRMMSVINLNAFDQQHRKGIFASTPVINGPCDNSLSKSFNINTTFTFLHPTDSTKKIVKSMVLKDTLVSYESVYFSDEELEPVLVNDTLYYHVTTQVL